jgi:hypothetical protein
VQGTEAASHPICWQESDAGGYWADVKGVRVEVSQSAGPTGGCAYLSFAQGAEKVYITEPQASSIFGVKYDDEDQRRLAELIRILSHRIARQCATRRTRALDQDQELRQHIFQCLVLGPDAAGNGD